MSPVHKEFIKLIIASSREKMKTLQKDIQMANRHSEQKLIIMNRKMQMTIDNHTS